MGSARATSSRASRSSSLSPVSRCSMRSRSRGEWASEPFRRQRPSSEARAPLSWALWTSSRRNSTLPPLAATSAWRVAPSTGPPTAMTARLRRSRSGRGPTSMRTMCSSFHIPTIAAASRPPERTVKTKKTPLRSTSWSNSAVDASSSSWASSTTRTILRSPRRCSMASAAATTMPASSSGERPTSSKSGASAPKGRAAPLFVARTATATMPRSAASSRVRDASRVLPMPAAPMKATPPHSGSSSAAIRARSSASRPTTGQVLS